MGMTTIDLITARVEQHLTDTVKTYVRSAAFKTAFAQGKGAVESGLSYNLGLALTELQEEMA